MVARSELSRDDFSSTVPLRTEDTTSHASSHKFRNYFSNALRALSSRIKSHSERSSSTEDNSENWSALGSQSWAVSQVSSVRTNRRRITSAEHNASFSIKNGTNPSILKPVYHSSSTIYGNLTFQHIPNITTSTISSSASELPIFAIIICSILSVIMTSVIMYFLCNCIYKRRKRRDQLDKMTPKASDPRMAGVRADQPIQFVVPTTIIAMNETTEDSLSDTDYSSGGHRQLPILLEKRRKKHFSEFQINPSDLQRGLYEGVAMKLGSSAFLGDLGKIGFSLRYNIRKSQLYVKVIGATDLPCLFLKTTGNPCAKVIMMPDRIPKYVTKVQRNTLNPVFNETFVFPVMREDLNSKKLKISVWDYDKFSRKLLIGQITYAVKDSELTHSVNVDCTTGDIWIDLKHEIDTHRKGHTELLFSLCYNPEISALTVSILKIRGMNIGEKEKETSVYAKVTLYVRRKMAKSKKTSSKRKTPMVEFNNSFTIHVPPTALSEVDLLVTVCEKSTGLGSKKLVGRTHVGSNCLTDQGLQHWQDMLLSQKSTSAQWHILSVV